MVDFLRRLRGRDVYRAVFRAAHLAEKQACGGRRASRSALGKQTRRQAAVVCSRDIDIIENCGMDTARACLGSMMFEAARSSQAYQTIIRPTVTHPGG